MKAPRIALLLLALSATKVNGQPKVGQVIPDRIVFDKVHADAIVEASFSVLAAPSSDSKIEFEITAPPFVKVLRKDTDDWAVGVKFVRGTVEFALDTTKVGELNGQIAVKLNSTSVHVPVSASVEPQRAGLLRLLVVETPFERYSTTDGGHFRQWTDLVAAAPWDVNYLLVHRDRLVLRDIKMSDFGAVILGPNAVLWLKPADVKRVRDYVDDGGSVIVMANYFFRGTVAKANTLLAGYGVVMADEEARGATAQVTIEKADLASQLVKAGVERVTFLRGSPVTVTNAIRARVLVPAVNVGQNGDGFVATANAGNGKMTALGQSLWWSWVSSHRDPYGGNAKLLRWLLTSAHERRQRFLSLKEPLSTAQIATCWTNLAADDLDEALEARHWLTRAPAADRQTAPFLKKHLSPDSPADPNRLKLLIAHLDGESFQLREKAQRELRNVDDLAVGALKRALAENPSLELQRRIQQILNKIKPPSREKRQHLRAIDVLEQLGTPDARELLQTLSKGAPGTMVTVAAQTALDRLRRNASTIQEDMQ